jgi:hypothetical protein
VLISVASEAGFVLSKLIGLARRAERLVVRSKRAERGVIMWGWFGLWWTPHIQSVPIIAKEMPLLWFRLSRSGKRGVTEYEIIISRF